MYKKKENISNLGDSNSYETPDGMQPKSEESKKTQKYYVQIDSFRITQEKVYYELIDIVKKYIKNNNSPKANAIKKVYNSLYNLNFENTSCY